MFVNENSIDAGEDQHRRIMVNNLQKVVDHPRPTSYTIEPLFTIQQ